MRAYFEAQIAERRRAGCVAGDLVSVLLRGRIEGEPLTDDELVGHCFLLFIAGNSTTAALVGNGTLVLARNPAERARFAADPGLGERPMEELLRFESPVQNMGRVTTREVELHGTIDPVRVARAAPDRRRQPRPPRFSRPRPARSRPADPAPPRFRRRDPPLHRGTARSARGAHRAAGARWTVPGVRGRRGRAVSRRDRAEPLAPRDRDRPQGGRKVDA